MGVPGGILCILMLLLHKSSQHQVFNDQDSLPEKASSWMETLNNEMLISKITIPGTHDSLARHWGPFVECQAWSLENQLNAGIRYFDLRVSGIGLIIVHGPMIQWTSLDTVLSTINTFLTKFKSEVVLVRIKPTDPKEEKVPNSVENVIKKYTNIWDKPSIPTIGEVRGKIVFVQKKTFTLGIILSETDEDGDYIVTEVTVKEEKITKHLEEAAANCRNGVGLSLVYSSGTSLPTYKFLKLLPKSLAEEINPWLYRHLEKEFKKNPKPCFGIIAMDYPGFDLIQKIIKFNA